MADEEIVVGSIVEGVVSGITHFGAFVLLPGGKTGLVHISEIADAYVKDIKDFVKEQDTVKVKILSFDGKQKIGLSIRQAQPRPQGVAAPSGRGPGPGSGGPRGGGFRRGGGRSLSFEDKLARYMKESDERLSDLRKHNDPHRGGGGSGGGGGHHGPKGKGEGTGS